MARKAKNKQSRNSGCRIGGSRWHFAGHVEVVGGYYHRMQEAIWDDEMESGSPVRMKREAHNIMDPNAIAVYTPSYRVGYIEKETAQRLAAFMDLGIVLAGRVLSVCNQPLRATVRLYARKA